MAGLYKTKRQYFETTEVYEMNKSALDALYSKRVKLHTINYNFSCRFLAALYKNW